MRGSKKLLIVAAAAFVASVAFNLLGPAGHQPADRSPQQPAPSASATPEAGGQQ